MTRPIGPRRLLAAILAESTDAERWKEAERLLESSDAGGLSVDQLLQAQVLLRRGGSENRSKARQILESLVADTAKVRPADHLMLAQFYREEGNPTTAQEQEQKARALLERIVSSPTSGSPSERVLLARLYLTAERWESARQQYLKVLSVKEPSATVMVEYVDQLLRKQLLDEADRWLKQLETVSGDSLGTVGLRARWLQAKGRAGEIEPLVEGLAAKLSGKLDKDKQKEVDLCQNLAGVYFAAEQFVAAERWFRRLVTLAPERYEGLALSLAREGRAGDAAQLCLEKGRAPDSMQATAVLSSVLLAGRPTAEDWKLVESALVRGAEIHQANAELLFNLGNVRILQDRSSEAAALYERTLKLKPAHVGALNNLASLLSEQSSGRAQALEYVDQAIRIGGRQPEFLDTKGVILLETGKVAEAALLLEQACAGPRPDPRYHFHLAVAYDRLGQTEKARETFRRVDREQLALGVGAQRPEVPVGTGKEASMSVR